MFFLFIRHMNLKCFLCLIFRLIFIYNFQYHIHIIIIHIMITDFTFIRNNLRIFASLHIDAKSFRHIRKRNCLRIYCDRFKRLYRVHRFFRIFRRRISHFRCLYLIAVYFNFLNRNTVASRVCIYFVKIKTHISIKSLSFYICNTVMLILLISRLTCHMLNSFPI